MAPRSRKSPEPVKPVGLVEVVRAAVADRVLVAPAECELAVELASAVVVEEGAAKAALAGRLLAALEVVRGVEVPKPVADRVDEVAAKRAARVGKAAGA